MSQPLRVDFPGARHHVYNRVKNREHALESKVARNLWIGHLEVLPMFQVEVHGFALMGNHFHLLLHSRTGRLSEAMQAFVAPVVRVLNAHHGWDGPLFRARFSNRIVESEAYWRHLLAYVHLNPVRAGRVRFAIESRATSHRAYLGLERMPWLTTHELLHLHGGRDALARYVDDLALGCRPAPIEFDPDDLWTPTEVLRQAPERRTLGDSLADVRRVLGKPVRRAERSTLDLALWWGHRGGCSFAELGRHFELSPQYAGRRVRAIECTAPPTVERWKRQLLERPTTP